MPRPTATSACALRTKDYLRGPRRTQTRSRLGDAEPELALSIGSVGARGRATRRDREETPSGAERQGQAGRCRRVADIGPDVYNKKLHGASARLWAEAFRPQPKLAEDMQAQNRYNAACAAALAGCGQGKDDPPLDEAAKARWRKQAIDWLKADLAFWTKQVETGPPEARRSVAKTLQHWKADTDLAGIRDEAALAKLPEDERKACRASGTLSTSS